MLSDETCRIPAAHLDVNALTADWVESLSRTPDSPPAPGRAARFRRELAAAFPVRPHPRSMSG